MPRKLTKEQFVEKANKVHKSKYDYSLVEYINNSTDITIICHTHGSFSQRPVNHISGRNGCPTCAQISRINTNVVRYGGQPACSARVKEKKVQT